MRRWGLVVLTVAALAVGIAGARLLGGHVTWMPVAVQTTVSPSPYASPYTVVSTSPSPFLVPGPTRTVVRTVVVTQSPEPDPLAFERCMFFTNEAMKAACDYGQGRTAVRPPDPGSSCVMLTGDLRQACLYGAGETLIRP